MLGVSAWYTKGLQIGIWHHPDIEEFPTPNLVLVGDFDEKFKSKTFSGTPNGGDISRKINSPSMTNELVGPISITRRLHKLQPLYFDGNRLEGPIPSELCHLESLYKMFFGGNELFGPIPTWDTNDSNCRIVILVLVTNVSCYFDITPT
jgi:hypothetical protein